ncbi:MAG: glycosyltransferase family 1 protein [Chthoniobacterales bacterium]|nr:glycosyltransferase family 1 protein [Chthoniobacterales bacterium]
MIISGHPTGNPNSHHAALAWHERGKLYKFCTPWFPSQRQLSLLGHVPGLRDQARRLARRHFEPLAGAGMRQSRLAEISRMVRERLGWTGPEFTRSANNWLMTVMASECRDRHVSAVHSFEDCSLRQFQEAKRLGKACIYDMPTCHWKFWESQHRNLCSLYADWIRPQDAVFTLNASPEQKDEELRLADEVLAPSTFVKRTLEEAGAKAVSVCRYGVDAEFWCPAGSGDQETAESARRVAKQPTDKRPRDEEQERLKDEKTKRQPEGGSRSPEAALLATSDSLRVAPALRFIYEGQCSLRKGIPFILEAWEKAGLRNAELMLVGGWQLAVERLKSLPPGVRYIGPVGPERLRELYRQSDAFVFPSFGDGFGLVMLEALASGLHVMASDRSGGPDLAAESGVTVLPAGNEEAWIAALREFRSRREGKTGLSEEWRWERYRRDVFEATKNLIG